MNVSVILFTDKDIDWPESSLLDRDRYQKDNVSGNPCALDVRTTHEISENYLDRISCTSDYERQSLDFERHSSEEELETIHREVVAEKRKWSQVHSGNCDSSGSVDEEVKELMLEPQPVLFSASPPVCCHGNKKLSEISGGGDYLTQERDVCNNANKNVIEPEPVLLLTTTSDIQSDLNSNLNFEDENEAVSGGNSCQESPEVEQIFVAKLTFPVGASSRKRHRQGSSSDRKSGSKSSLRRPSLDFEKMQVRHCDK